MNFPTIILVLMVILNAGLALLVILNNSKSSINKFFSLFIIAVLLWMSANYFANFPGSVALFWTKITFLGAIMLACFVVYFSIYFPWIKRKIYWWEHCLMIIPTVLISLLVLFTSTVVADITVIETGTGVQQGSLYYLWPVYFLAFIIAALILLVKKYKLSEEKEKLQIRFVFIGLFLSLLLAIITNLIFPVVFKNDTLSNIGPYSSIVFIAFTAYAIIKHEFMNIKVIASETLVVFINIALLINVLYSENLTRGLVSGVILLFSVVAGFMLIKAVIREVRQKEKLQELTTQLAQANAHLKELDSMKTEFVSLASHELLTPVSAIEGYLSMLLDEKLAKVEDPTAARYLDRIYKSARRLARLIADMLNISRIEEGRLLVEKKDVSVNELISQVLDEIKFKAEEKKQKVVCSTCDIKNTENFESYADQDKVKEVLVNLIGNAIKYSRDPGTVTISVKKVPSQIVQSTWAKIENDIKGRPLDDQEAIKSAVDPRLKELVGEEQILISVKDEGIGIPREELSRLFKKFHRVGNFSTQESQGTGLGLYISRALVELHHGRIWADSEGEGKGSTFTFSLPDISVKQKIIDLEAQIPQDKEKLKPLAKPMNSKIDK